MALALVHSRARCGLQAPLVTVEVHLSRGLPGFQLVGLPETSVKEAKDRVRSALINSGFEFPDHKITVNLAPADLPKEGGRFDLAIALGILHASGQLQADLSDYEFFGELALSGEIRSIVGEIPLALACKLAGHIAVFPLHNAIQAQQIADIQLCGAEHLLQLHAFLLHQQALPAIPPIPDTPTESYPDLAEVRGQAQAKRALEIAAAGEHNLLMFGPAGTGKSMLAQRLPGILPELNDQEALETAAIYSVAAQPRTLQQWHQRPFRQPHHTCSAVALVGGGSVPRPGEISLAHSGILFLDEVPEFPRAVLESLRQPLETGKVFISRAARQAEFPACFQLVVALNPSPSGHHKDGRSSPEQVRRYLSRLSGPFLDRIELQVEVPLLPKGSLSQHQQEESSAQVKQRVLSARHIQWQRQGKSNARLNLTELQQYCQLAPADADFFEHCLHQLKLSARSYHKLVKVARTLADLAQRPQIERADLLEALSYRSFDRLLNYLQS
ncbi:ATP-dependent protease [Rheinheimera mesophila]|uniref:ATP-dependent protease n=1 Tax=Rheinheimera mesophila TaxID=1547515 RepID=A0A3P3QJS7_9GAMM|nr:YifB family Mg chelatase-like AAA ATPase [Rheinheimera mesophila]KKK99955.1 ATP-dependent protease [Rheinheimera mesophila]RRJ21414.1 ATP-dependent protease [Rheinheimera mesophila]